MKYLKRFNEAKGDNVDYFLNGLIKETKTLKWTINSDGSYDFDGSVIITGNITELPITIRSVKGIFLCHSRYFESLEGFPRYVSKSFSILHCNLITSLEGCPEEVGSNFYCGGTGITDLKGAPRMVGGFNCQECELLTSLEGLPKIIGSDLRMPRFASINFENCPNLIFPTDLRDCQLVLDNGNEFKGTPLHIFQTIFDSLKTFQESLDYNYIGGLMEVNGEMRPTINLFKFQEALDEFGIEIFSKKLDWKPGQLGEYILVNERGRRVDFGGNEM